MSTEARRRRSAAIGSAPSFARESGLLVSQANGDVPGVVSSAHAPGEHGISFMRNSLPHGVDSAGTALHHTVFVTVATQGRITTQIEGKSESFVPQVGTVAIIPEGAQCSSQGTGAMASFILMLPKDTLAFAAAERVKAGASVIERLKGEDPALLQLCHQLGRHVLDGFVDDALAWYELSNAVVERMIDAHVSGSPAPIRGSLSPQALARVLECIHANIDGPLNVDELAEAAQQTWSHFPRLFRRATGLSPYQYVIKVRLESAFKLLRSQRMSIAEVAVRSGFADQSHLCRWARRAHGLAPSQLMAAAR